MNVATTNPVRKIGLQGRHCLSAGAIVLAVLLWSFPGCAQGMLDNVPQSGMQKVTPNDQNPAAKQGGLTPKEKEERLLRMPQQPTTNYNFLEGCWLSDVFQHAPNRVPGTSTYCFDADGRGTLVFETVRGTCRVSAQASYQGGMLRFVDSDGVCSHGGPWWADHLDCERGSDGVAACRGSSRTGSKWTVSFRRTSGGQKPANSR